MVILDSVDHPNAGAPIGAPPWPDDWDTLLDAALTDLGLQTADTLDWPWYPHRSAD
jgi:hypothetical protein